MIDDEALTMMAEKNILFDPNFTVFHRFEATQSQFNYNAEGAGWMLKGAAMTAEAIGRLKLSPP